MLYCATLFVQKFL